MSKVITIGADPEVFVQDNGEIVPVCGKIGGDKWSPLKVDLGAIQEDNVLAEFNIDPVGNVVDFKRHIKHVMSQLKQHLRCDVRVKASHHFDKQTLMDYPQSLEFGCDPDFHAYTGNQNEKPDPYTTLRTAGGHIHVGYPNPTEESNRRIIQAMDILLGIPSVLMDDDASRRQLYGSAGAYRNKPYGVEYRSLSNFWLASESHQEWAFNQAVAAVDYDVADAHRIVSADEIERIINTSDRKAALAVATELGLEVA